jgi:hypothetical protein
MRTKILGSHNALVAQVLAAALAMVHSLAFGASSTFDTGMDGWTQTSGVSQFGTGGNPGGYLRFDDQANGGLGTGGRIYAPAAYLGDWISAYGSDGLLSLDYQLQRRATIDPGPVWIQIFGNGREIARNLPLFSGLNQWETFTISFDSNTWAKAADTVVADVLSNVTEFRINMFAGTSADEITAIDNVWVRAAPREPPPSVPEPGTLALFGLGIAGLGIARRAKK